MKAAPLLLLLAACGGATAPGPGPVRGDAPAVVLCVDPDARLGRPLELPADAAMAYADETLADGRRVLARGPAAAPGYVVVTSPTCAPDAEPDAPCDVTLVRLDAAGHAGASLALPDGDRGFVMGDVPVLVDLLAATDADGDGRDELLVVSTATGEPAPAIGSTSTSTLFLLDPTSLEVRLEVELDRVPEAETLPTCHATIAFDDVTCDGVADAIVRWACAPRACEDDDGAYAEVDPTVCAPIAPTVTTLVGSRAGTYEALPAAAPPR